MLAVALVPNVMTGNTNDFQPSIMPEEGSQSKCTEKIIINIRACQNTGMDTPASAATVTVLSKKELGRTADITPAGMPISAATVTAYRASFPVAGRCKA